MTLKTAISIAVLAALLPSTLVRAQAAPPTQLPAAAKQSLQGAWEGPKKGRESDGRYKLTITGDALRYQGPKAEEWYEAKFTLPEGKFPLQLHATITGSPRKDDVGAKVTAVFKIEDGTLSLAGYDANAPAGWDPFDENEQFLYELRKVEPRKGSTPTGK
jgi:hypothetical protein